MREISPSFALCALAKSLVFVLTQFPSNRSKYVVMDGYWSNLVNVVSGVSQGSVFGSLLFLLYSSELILC